jgi:superfamily II DNA or RNA helicase
MFVKPGRYIRFNGEECEVIGTAAHSETLEELVVFRAQRDGGRLWARPAAMWNETVDLGGREARRFTHVDDIAPKAPVDNIELKAPVDDIAPKAPAGIHKYSAPSEKIKLFMSLFMGRDDVFAKRWENAKKGTAGYAPACNSAWSPQCPKSGGGKMRCGECPSQNFARFGESAAEKHLTGQMTVGAYPMFLDETCRFLAFDFDGKGKDYSPDALRRDVGAIRAACAEKGISMAVERSRSGQGIHFWMFFAENVPASTARKFGSCLITCAMDKNHSLSFKTYDRMIPAQDTLPKGGFGSLIALPLQKAPRAQGNSAFVDESFNAYPDQWSYLYGVKRYTLDETEAFIRQLSPSGELGDLRRDSEDEKPWEKKRPEPKLARSDFPDAAAIVSANLLHIDKSGFSSAALNALKRLAAFRNPDFYKAQAMRLSTFGKPRIISCSDETERYLSLPRGLADEVREILKGSGAEARFIDKTNGGRSIDVRFNGKLRGEQQQAADALLAHGNGILSAATAFGKTVIGAHLIAERRVNTLVLVHRTSLLAQWQSKLSEFLTIGEEPAAELTPKGRKRKKAAIGQIGGGKNNPSGIVDVAVMQSLVSGGEVKELVRDYGMVIVDECHHVSAFSFEQILKAVNAKYVYGLTATPARQDGHHPIICMHCGKIRYRVDAKEQADARPFEHFVIPRFTRFQKPARQEDGKWPITAIYSDIQDDEPRNSLILQDVISAVEQGRSPIILTERTGHVKYLAARLAQSVKNVISLTGGGTRKKSRETLQTVADIPGDEPFVLVATGKYAGEGFDMPRLDTLFLAMPISWKGTLQQYAGRLHRLYGGKKEVQVYDYVDVHVAMLERMYQKRLRGYASIGYKGKGSPQPLEEAHSIFDGRTFFPVYSADVLAAGSEILIVSPFVAKRRVLSALNYLAAAKAKVTVVTKPPENYAEKDRWKIAECMELLAQHGVAVKTRDRIHQKFAIMDQRVGWYGSINLLSYGASEESIMRIENPDIAGELLRGAQY